MIRKSAIFYRNLATHIIILLLPLFILGIVIYSYFIGIFQTEVINRTFEILRQTGMSVDFQLAQIKNLSDQIFINNTLRPFYFETDTFAGIKAIRELKRYNVTNEFISDIVIYNATDKYLFSSSSSYTIERFCSIFGFVGLDKNNFSDEMRKITAPAVRADENVSITDDGIILNRRFITFIYPEYIYGIITERRAAIMVADSAFTSIMSVDGQYGDSNMLVLDRNGRLITASVSGLDVRTVMDNIPAGSDDVSRTVKIGKKEYLMLYYRSQASGWQYVKMIGLESALSDVILFKYIFILCVSIVFIIGCIAIWKLADINYAPIINLKRYAEGLKTGYKEKTHADELEIVKGTMDALLNKTTELSNQIQYDAGAVKDYFLYRLLKGRIPSASYLNEKGAQCGVILNKGFFGVAIFFSDAFNESDDSKYTNYIVEMLPGEIQGYIREYGELSNLVLVASLDSGGEDELDKYLRGCILQMKELFNIELTAGLGGLYADFSLMPKSYMEALTAVDYRFIMGGGNVIKFNDIADNQSLIDKNLNKIPHKLGSLIKKGSIEQINWFLENITEYIKTNAVSMFVARMACFDIINTVIRTVNEITIEHNIPISEYPDIFMISSFQTIDELAETVYRISRDVSQYMNAAKEKSDLAMIDQMYKYIRDNYTDCDFSIQQMAEDFNINMPGISVYFKEHTGMTILDYVTELKMNKAKQLLLTTKKPIKDISLEVGYFNMTSFMRRFKQINGLTPSEYKKEYAADT